MLTEGQPLRAVALKNYSTGQMVHDRLYSKSVYGPCSAGKVCTSSNMTPAVVKPTYVRPQQELLQQAKSFLEEYYDINKKRDSEEYQKRWEQVQQEVEAKGTYDLTYDEIVVGARLAWRNAPRCIGRIQWSNLKVTDARHVRTAKEMFDCIVEHVKYATNGGMIRSMLTLFPHRVDPKFDFRVWNSQLISYAAYTNPDGTITGDPINLEFTDLCLKMGWKSKRTRFDILPMVLQANGEDPELFEYPEDLILQVPLSHPNYPWFEELGLRWYVVPAVSSMLFDVGGIQFPAAPFNGWYMGTEIGARDLCDVQRYNLAELIGQKMGLDTGNLSTLWKDTVVLETNKAVLHSFQKYRVTIWDHHTASETFMQFFGNEMRTRGGCPADWVWLMPPMSSSVCPVFHQEMAFYFLKPNYEYQIPAWKTYQWKNEAFRPARQAIQRKKVTWRVAALSVRFSVALFRKCVQKRPLMTVLYASESGKSEQFASVVSKTFSCLFRVQVKCMADYQAYQLVDEAIVVVVTSTFGSGDPPTNGVDFHKQLMTMQKQNKSLAKGNQAPKFVVFALGSTAYPNFCSFGKLVDRVLGEMGAKSLMSVTCGDELNGQEQTFRSWLKRAFLAVCKDFFGMGSHQAVAFLGPVDNASAALARFVNSDKKEDLVTGLSQVHSKTVSLARLSNRSIVSSSNKDHSILLICLDTFGSLKMQYQAGDHLAIIPRNPDDVVKFLMTRLKNSPGENSTVQIQVQNNESGWADFHKIPPCTLNTLLSRYVDLNAPPSQSTLRVLAAASSNPDQVKQLLVYAEDWDQYDKWVHEEFPTVAKVLIAHPTIQPDAAALISTLPLIQPRYYSISSSSTLFPTEIHLTMSVVHHSIAGKEREVHRGLCTSYLAEINEGEFVVCFMRSAPYFHLPFDVSRPVLLIGAGSGIAPFRSFWLERGAQLNAKSLHFAKNQYTISVKEVLKYLQMQRSIFCLNQNNAGVQFGSIDMYYGCREKSVQLYAKEVAQMMEAEIINEGYIALSRQTGKPKMYVQDLLRKNGATVCRQILHQGAHVFVCGSASLATQVEDALKKIIRDYGNMNDEQTEYVFKTLQDEERYHLDVFSS